MTNEEIVLQLQSEQKRTRQRPLLELLYLQNKGIINKLANSYSYDTGLEFDDLVQEGYFCMIAAAAAYDPKAGYKYLTYLANALRWRFKRMKHGLHDHVSLDQGLSYDDELCMYDVIPDKNIDLEGNMLDEFFMSEVGKDLQRALDGLTKPEKRIICQRYNEGLSNSDIAILNGYRDANGASYALQKAMHNLRRAPILKKWRPFFSDQAAAAAYQHIGVSGYQRTGISSTEKAAYKDMGIRV